MNTFHILSISLLLSQPVLAQVPLSLQNNRFRSGDVLCKVEIGYVDPGEAGRDKVWALGTVTDDSRDFVQGIASKGDTIAIFEQDRICHYLMHGDTLCYKGEQQRRAYRLYSQERPMIVYPYSYGDSICGRYVGKGREENSGLTLDGWGYTVADGTGMLTDGEDTLRHIARLRMFDDYTEDYDGRVAVRMQQIQYRWYCAGYRYPVMESVLRCAVVDGGVKVPIDSVSYLYLPVRQLWLSDDAVNDSLQTQIALADALINGKNGADGSLSDIKARLSADGMQLTIDYTLTGDGSSLDFSACDILGNVLGSAQYESKEAGQWQECLILSRKPVGNALMLNVKCGEYVNFIKVYKIF